MIKMLNKIEKFLNYERKNKLNEKYPQWTYIRSIYLSHLAGTLKRTNLLNVNDLINIRQKRIKNRYYQFFSLSIKLLLIIMCYPFLPSAKKVISMVAFLDRKEKDFYPCRYTYKYYDLYEGNAIIINKAIDDYKMKEIIKTKNQAYFVMYSIFCFLYDIVKYKIVGYEEIENRDLHIIEDMILNFELINNIISDNEMINIIKSKVKSFNRLNSKRFYHSLDKMLSKIGVSNHIFVSFSGAQNQIINKKLKHTKIKTIELQHGTFINNYTYSFFEKKIKSFPKYLFVFGDYWKDKACFPISKKNIISVGLPVFNLGLEKSNEKKRETILILSSKIDVGLIKFTNKLISEFGSDYKIVFKLHPATYSKSKEYRLKLDDRINIIDDHKLNLYELFNTSKCVIGLASMSLYEAYGYNLPVFILYDEIYTKNFMSDFLTFKNVFLLRSIDDFIEKIDIINSTKILNDKSKLWKQLNDNELIRILDF
jgi:hypothetical protein